MDRVEAVDKYTAKVTMSQPVSTWFNGVTEVRNFMLPRETIDVGFKDPLKFAGMGAFMVTKFQEGAEEVFERFDKYYREGQPHMDKIVLLAMPDRAATLSAFISKQTSVFTAPTKEERKSIEGARPDALFYEYGGINWQYMRPNLARVKALQDVRVRKALRYAIDFKEVGDGYHGSGWNYLAAMHPGFPEGWSEDKVKTLPGYNPATKDKDRAEALKMLDAAGFKNGAGIAFELLDKKKADNHENAVRIQGQMLEAIPEMKITLKSASDGASFNKQQADGEFEVIANDSTMQPDAVLESTAHFHSTGSRNYGNFKDKENDAMLEKALAETDAEARKEILDTWQQKFMDEWQPLIMLYTTPVKAYLQPDIGGFDKIAGPWTGGRHTVNKVGNLYYV
jgi:ABC-type transport system substrate-binding protein